MKRSVLVISGIIVCFLIFGYLYFEYKFTPETNTLKVSQNATKIKIEWGKTKSNEYASLLLPVKINNRKETFYMQLDFGSPYTLFYKKSLNSIKDNNLKINEDNRTKLKLSINEMNIESNKFRVINYGNSISKKKINIIGTIGTDLLEKRIITLNLKNNTCSFTEENNFKNPTEFEFKKRRIILPAKMLNKKVNLMYDSGTSGYQLITDKTTWKKIQNTNSKIKEENGNSWGNNLTIKTAKANSEISLNNKHIKLNEITYIEGTSKFQNFLMKISGMEGMIGNKLFLNEIITIDCKNEIFEIK